MTALIGAFVALTAANCEMVFVTLGDRLIYLPTF